MKQDIDRDFRQASKAFEAWWPEARRKWITTEELPFKGLALMAFVRGYEAHVQEEP